MPAHAEAGEEEGWLIGLVIEPDEHGTALEIIDARSFEAPPIAVVRLPHRVPPGIHGAWLPA